jgi:hypothetical protein
VDEGWLTGFNLPVCGKNVGQHAKILKTFMDTHPELEPCISEYTKAVREHFEGGKPLGNNKYLQERREFVQGIIGATVEKDLKAARAISEAQDMRIIKDLATQTVDDTQILDRAAFLEGRETPLGAILDKAAKGLLLLPDDVLPEGTCVTPAVMAAFGRAPRQQVGTSSIQSRPRSFPAVLCLKVAIAFVSLCRLTRRRRRRRRRLT